MAVHQETIFMRMESINVRKGLLKPLRHNLREDQNERGARQHIDPEKANLNYQLEGIGNAEQVKLWADALIAESGAKVRKNASLAIEILFSLPTKWHSSDTRPYFQDCLQWLRDEFEGIEVLSFAVHLDESAPHAHVLLLSLKDGKLCGSEIMGDRGALQKRHDSFYWKVANKHGLKKPPRKLSAQQQERVFKDVSAAIHGEGLIPKSKVYSLIMDEIRKSPVKYAQALGLELPDKTINDKRTFAAIMTKPVDKL